ncbi:MAG: uncharacterized protein KVP18_004178 [Porospora cf. gigantea A]|uniref:uncharacterized protein n=1 Tax=Porospora cf. gigantea A TaxID=2853593 RepID=UPI00355AB536|nr:MAG: hypothetical protein KVP18_004178 [Porospora cf. gigantea A]
MTTVVPVMTFEEARTRGSTKQKGGGHHSSRAWLNVKNLFSPDVSKGSPRVNIVVGSLEDLPKSCLKRPADASSVASDSTTVEIDSRRTNVRFRKGFVTAIYNYPTDLDKDLKSLRHVKYASTKYAKLCRERRQQQQRPSYTPSF